MVPDRDNLKRMLASLDVAIAGAVKYHPDEGDFRTTLRASVRLLMLEASGANWPMLKQRFGLHTPPEPQLLRES